MISSLETAKHLAREAGEAQAAGDHRRAARLYMHAVLALTGVVPNLETPAISAQSAASPGAPRKTMRGA